MTNTMEGMNNPPVPPMNGPGRVVLEDPTALLGALQKSIAAHKRDQHVRGSLVDRLLKDRRGDKSLM